MSPERKQTTRGSLSRKTTSWIKRVFGDRTLLILLGAGLVVRLIVAIPVFTDPSRTAACSDTVAYEQITFNLLDGHGFSVNFHPPYEQASKITPGYPFFLASVYAIFARSRLAVIIIQIVLSLIPLVVFYRFVRGRFGERAALWGGIIFILDANLAMYVNQIMTETLFIALFIPAFILILESMEATDWGRVIGGGLLLGASTLIRPIVVYFGAILLLWIFLTRFRWSKLARWGVILGFQLMCIVPWVVRNRVVFDEVFYTTVSEVNLWRLHAAGVKASVEGTSREQAQKELKEEALEGKEPQNEAQYYRILGNHARSYLIKHPLRYVSSLVLGGAATLFYPLALGETAIYVNGKHPEITSSRVVFVEILKGRVISGIKHAWHDRLMPFGTAVVIFFILYGLFHFAKLAFGLRAWVQ